MNENLKRKAKKLLDNSGNEFLTQLEATMDLADKLDSVVEAVKAIPEPMPMPEHPKEMSINNFPETIKIEIANVGAFKGADGKDGENGKDYVLTSKDKKEIASLVKVPVVEKVVERIETIKATKISETPVELRDKLESLEGEERLDVKAIKGLKELLDSVKVKGKSVMHTVMSLSGLFDVSISGATNGQALVWNSTTQRWENGTVSGGTGSPSGPTGSIQYNDGAGGFAGTSNFTYDQGSNNVLLTAREYITINSATPLTTDNPTLQATNSINGYTQMSIQNRHSGANSSADIIAYSDGITADEDGFMDMGFTSSGFADPLYAVTGPHEGYLFASAHAGQGTGNMILATDSTGSANEIAFFTGGFNSLANERLRIKTSSITTPNDVEITSASTGIILKSPNGTRFRIGITNNGELTATSI